MRRSLLEIIEIPALAAIFALAILTITCQDPYVHTLLWGWEAPTVVAPARPQPPPFVVRWDAAERRLDLYEMPLDVLVCVDGACRGTLEFARR